MAKMAVGPNAVGQVQVRMMGLHKERAHQVRLIPPPGRGDPIDEVVIADREGEGSVTMYLYAQGDWTFEVRLNGADKEPMVTYEMSV